MITATSPDNVPELQAFFPEFNLNFRALCMTFATFSFNIVISMSWYRSIHVNRCLTTSAGYAKSVPRLCETTTDKCICNRGRPPEPPSSTAVPPGALGESLLSTRGIRVVHIRHSFIRIYLCSIVSKPIINSTTPEFHSVVIEYVTLKV